MGEVAPDLHRTVEKKGLGRQRAFWMLCDWAEMVGVERKIPQDSISCFYWFLFLIFFSF